MRMDIRLYGPELDLSEAQREARDLRLVSTLIAASKQFKRYRRSSKADEPSFADQLHADSVVVIEIHEDDDVLSLRQPFLAGLSTPLDEKEGA